MTATESATRVHTAIRAWAKGVYVLEAAVELLIRGFDGDFAGAEAPWIDYVTDESDRMWVDAERLRESMGVYSSGEKVYLGFVAHLLDPVSSQPVDLSDLARLDYDLVELVLAGLSHAAGAHQRSKLVKVDRFDPVTGDRYTMELPVYGQYRDPIVPWPVV